MALTSCLKTGVVPMSPTTGLYLSGSLLKSDSGFAVPTKLQSVRKSDRERLRIQAVFSFPPAFLTRNGRAEKQKQLKQDLLEAIEPLERGATASPDDQLRIDQLARKVEAVNPTKEPLKSDLLNGKWELIYTTSASILQAKKPKFLRSITNYQSINVDTLKVQNMETWPFFNSVTGDIRPLNSRKVAVQLKVFKILGLIPVNAPETARGELEITYVDEELRLSREELQLLFIYFLQVVGPYPKLYDAGAVKFDVRASSSRKSLKKQRRESQQGKDITTRSITEVDQEEEVIAQVDADTSTSKASINVVAAPRDKVLQACTVTSGLMAALGLVIRKASHVASTEGLPIPDCSADIPFGFETWHLGLIAGTVVLISSSRFLLLKSWPDFADSSEAANQQILTSLEPLDYLVVASLPGISEEMLFRGGLMPLFGTSWVSIVGVGLIFGLLHLGSGRKYSFAAWASVVGIVYGYAAVLSSSLVVPMASHALNNLVGGLLWRYSSSSNFKSLELLSRSVFPCLIHKAPRTNSSSFWIPVIQVFSSFNLLFSIVMSVNLLQFKSHHWRRYCYLWAVWVEGPLGFGLLMSCRITQAFQLYFIFVKKRLPPVKSYVFLPLVLLPWIFGAAIIHARKPLSNECHLGLQWTFPVAGLHALYVLALVAFTRAVRHVEFRFDELRDLWKGILVSAASVVIWVTAFVLNEILTEISWLQVASRFVLLVTGGVLVVVFFSISSNQPLLSQISLKKKDNFEFQRMSLALGIPDSGLLFRKEEFRPVDPNEPLDKLLLNKRFRQSLMEFADSCYAGETLHFYEEVYEHGAEMEVNLSHKTRQEILTTQDLTHPDLFKNALNEVMQLIKMNLLRDYWSSIYFIKFKEEESCDKEGWSFSPPRISSVQGSDDPFYQEHLSKSPPTSRCTSPG
ncbi:hypothetical protein YC2023_085390 [Brassica napus]